MIPSEVARFIAPWHMLGFNICPGCGRLDTFQPAVLADAFSSVFIENPGLNEMLCDCR